MKFLVHGTAAMLDDAGIDRRQFVQCTVEAPDGDEAALSGAFEFIGAGYTAVAINAIDPATEDKAPETYGMQSSSAETGPGDPPAVPQGDDLLP
jgi:hypothetical protein